MKNPASLLLFSLILLLPITLFAQSEKIYFKEYSIKDGLPEETVRSIIQDEQGFIWFATQNVPPGITNTTKRAIIPCGSLPRKAYTESTPMKS